MTKITTEAPLCCAEYVNEGNLSYRLQRLKWRIKDFFYRDTPKDSSLYQHAHMELEHAGYFKPDDEGEPGKGMNKMMADSVLELMAVFAKQGHSGFSARFCINLFETLAKYEPLGPLTGEDNEWMDVSEHCGVTTYQNRRCGHVFKEGRGKAYDIDGKVFKEPNGACYTSKDSRVYIDFPYTPKREYVAVPDSEETT